MKKLTTGMLLLLALTASVLLLAQMPPVPPDPTVLAQHRVKFLTTLLTLNTSQQQQATTIFTNAATSEFALQSQVRTARQSLNTAVKNNDAASIDQMASALGALSAQRTSIQAKANAAFYQILTPDQQNKLNQLESDGPGSGLGILAGGPGFFLGMEH